VGFNDHVAIHFVSIPQQPPPNIVLGKGDGLKATDHSATCEGYARSVPERQDSGIVDLASTFFFTR
jgi:hypothetical protein